MTYTQNNTAGRAAGGRVHRPLPVRLTARDLELLQFIAVHRFVEAAHVHELLGADRTVTYRLLSRLTSAGLVRYERIFHAQPGIFLITHGGLAVIHSALPKPTVDLRLYRHERLVVWLWLAAQQGSFGESTELLTERQLRHRLQTSGDPGPVPALGGFDRAGRPRVHYPDLVVHHPDGQLTGVELELSVKGRRRLEEIILAYQLDHRYRQVTYLTDQQPVAKALNTVIDGCTNGTSRVRVLLCAGPVDSCRVIGEMIRNARRP